MTTGRSEEGAASAVPLPVRLLTPLVRIGGALSTLLIIGALGLTAYSVVMRYGLNRPPVWIDQVTGWLLVALIMFGVTEAYRRGNHISIDLLTEKLSPRGDLLRQTWSDLCVLGFAVVLGVSTWEAVGFARSFGSFTPGPIEIESWLPQLPLLAGAILLGLFAIARLIGRLGRAFAR